MALTSNIPENEKYPNQPLVEVACEIRFFGEPSIETKRDVFYEAIRDRYPLIYVPPTSTDVHPALQHYKFRNEDNSSGVSLALNSFSYFQKDYMGYDEYIKEALQLFELANNIFKIQKFSRLGWRYINAIPFVRENDNVPINRFFNNPPGFFAVQPTDFLDIDFRFTTRCDGGTVAVLLGSNVNDKGDEAFIFDIDVSKGQINDCLNLQQIEEIFGKLHCIGRNYFESAISNEYRRYLKGEYDE